MKDKRMDFLKVYIRYALLPVSAFFFFFATAAIPFKWLIPSGIAIIMMMVWLLKKEGKKEKINNIWLRVWLVLMDLTSIFYLLGYFPFLYPSVIEMEASFLGKYFPWLSLWTISPCTLLICFASIPFVHWAMSWILYWAEPEITTFFNSFSKTETLCSILLFVILAGGLTLVSMKCSVWIAPFNPDIPVVNDPWNPEKIQTNAILGSDCRSFTSFQNCSWLNIFRHPFYSIALFPFLPFYLILTVMLWICGYGVWFYSAALAMAWLQIGWWVMGAVFLRRLIEKITDVFFSYAICVFYAFSFPVIFTFVPERLILTLFTLLAFVYFRQMSVRTDKSRLSAFDFTLASAAVGTTLTSVLIPLFSIWQNKESVHGFLKETVRFSLMGLIVMLFLAPSAFDLSYGISECFKWTSIPGTEKGLISNPDCHQSAQYLHFLAGNLFPPDVYAKASGLGSASAASIKPFYLWLGGLIGIMSFLGFWVFRKSEFVQTAFFWFLTALLLLGVIGFGARLNEMLLYVSYFSWAILPLCTLPVYRLLGKYKKTASMIVLLLAFVTFGLNVSLFINVVQHGMGHFIVP